MRKLVASFFLMLSTIGAFALDRPLTVWVDGLGKMPYVNKEAPPLSESTFYAAVLGNILTTNSSYELKPSFLKSWTWDYRTNSYLLELKPNLRFHNGREATATDLEFSLLRGALSGNHNYFRVFFNNIVGMDSLKTGTPYRTGMLKGIRVIDPLHLRISLKNPNPSFLHNLCYTFCSLVPRESVKEDNVMLWKTLPVGAGPYRVTEASPEQSRVHLAKVATDNKTAAAEIDLYTGNVPNGVDLALWHWDDLPNMTRVVGDHSDSVVVILFNFNHKLAKHLPFRKALALALNRGQMAEGFDYVRPTVDYLPAHFWGRYNPPEKQDVEKAKAILAGLPEDLKALTKQPIRVPVRASMKPKVAFDRIEAQLKAIGLNIEFYPNTKKFWEKDHAETALWIVSFVMGDVDPILKFGTFRADGPILPFAPAKDADFEKLYQDAARASSLDLRVESVKALSKYVYDQTMLLPVFEKKPVHWYNPKVISGLGNQDGGYWIYLDRVTVP